MGSDTIVGSIGKDIEDIELCCHILGRGATGNKRKNSQESHGELHQLHESSLQCDPVVRLYCKTPAVDLTTSRLLSKWTEKSQTPFLLLT